MSSVTEQKIRQIRRTARLAQQACAQLFGKRSPQVEQIDQLVENLEAGCRVLELTIDFELPTIAIIGPNKTGKSWLTGLFLPEELSREVVSGCDEGSATLRLQGFGPQCHPAFDDSDEHISDSSCFKRTLDLVDFGNPYVVLDSPGSTDADSTIIDLAHHALLLAEIKILVVKFEQIRAGMEELHKGEGSIFLPVIRYPSSEDLEEVKNDARKRIAGWRKEFPKSTIEDPIWMPDAGGHGEEEARKQTLEALKATLPTLLRESKKMEQSIAWLMDGLLRDFRHELNESILADFRFFVQEPYKNLKAKKKMLVGEEVPGILGDDRLLRAGLRAKLRADWLDRTPGWCFPYRSMTGLLSLTHGAWDRLVFAAFGSLPSIALSIFQAGKNIKHGRKMKETIKNPIRSTLERRIRAKMQEEIKDFSAAVRKSIPREESNRIKDIKPDISVTGLDQLKQDADGILNDEVKINRSAGAWGCALAGALTFWGFLSGPLYGVYRAYFTAYGDLFGVGASSPFPEPSFSKIATSFSLSLLPVFLLAMTGLWSATQQKRVDKCAKKVRIRFDNKVQALDDADELAVKIDDDNIEAAHTLLTLSDPVDPSQNVSS